MSSEPASIHLNPEDVISGYLILGVNGSRKGFHRRQVNVADLLNCFFAFICLFDIEMASEKYGRNERTRRQQRARSIMLNRHIDQASGRGPGRVDQSHPTI